MTNELPPSKAPTLSNIVGAIGALCNLSSVAIWFYRCCYLEKTQIVPDVATFLVLLVFLAPSMAFYVFRSSRIVVYLLSLVLAFILFSQVNDLVDLYQRDIVGRLHKMDFPIALLFIVGAIAFISAGVSVLVSVAVHEARRNR